mmetsp:Transcript_53751/g.123239  ORF Transcript_53751/g.123239 Transcript_53751/m.123239 type:complete len:363 (+) Transcript_53751:371-1459(+)
MGQQTRTSLRENPLPRRSTPPISASPQSLSRPGSSPTGRPVTPRRLAHAYMNGSITNVAIPQYARKIGKILLITFPSTPSIPTTVLTAIMLERQTALPTLAPQACTASRASREMSRLRAAACCTAPKVRLEMVVDPEKNAPRDPRSADSKTKAWLSLLDRRRPIMLAGASVTVSLLRSSSTRISAPSRATNGFFSREINPVRMDSTGVSNSPLYTKRVAKPQTKKGTMKGIYSNSYFHPMLLGVLRMSLISITNDVDNLNSARDPNWVSKIESSVFVKASFRPIGLIRVITRRTTVSQSGMRRSITSTGPVCVSRSLWLSLVNRIVADFKNRPLILLYTEAGATVMAPCSWRRRYIASWFKW